MRNIARFFITAIILSSLGCSIPSMDQSNNADGSQSAVYEGFPAVDNPDYMISYTPEGSVHKEPKFVVSKVIDAQAYHIQIASDATFENIVFEKDDFTTYVIKVNHSSFSLEDHYYFWRVRVKIDDIWSNWKNFGSIYVKSYKIGDCGQAGGVIFYKSKSYSDGWRYLEAAPAGWNGTLRDPVCQFGGYRTPHSGTSSDIGSGRSNTEKIIQKLGSGNYAALIAADYVRTVDGVIYDDWFLPSREELAPMYLNLFSKGLGGLSAGFYWSSSEYSDWAAWVRDFVYQETLITNANRNNLNKVRPVRRF